MPHYTDIVVHGTGIVSRAVALLLARERLRVVLSQRETPASADVRAYALNAAARELLMGLRAWPDAAEACLVRRMEVAGDDGSHLVFDAAELGVQALTWIADVPAIEARLEQAVDFTPGIERLAPADMDAARGALEVICEGRFSQRRAALGVQWDMRPYPHTALAARVQAERPHGGVARQWFLGGDILALLPLPPADGNLLALVWSVNGDRADALSALTDEAFCAALAQASAHTLGGFALTSARSGWPLRLARADRLSGPGWVLAGDAAHAMHPLAGQGLNVGLGDAAELARVIAAREYWRSPGDARLLRRYERARRLDVLAMGELTDGLYRLFAHRDPRVRSLRNAGLAMFERMAPAKRFMARRAMGLKEQAT